MVFDCKRLHDYLYLHWEVIVERDLKPFETIIHQPPLHLKKMILRMKPYVLNLKYILGSHLFLVDALSRA